MFTDVLCVQAVPFRALRCLAPSVTAHYACRSCPALQVSANSARWGFRFTFALGRGSSGLLIVSGLMDLLRFGGWAAAVHISCQRMLWLCFQHPDLHSACMHLRNFGELSPQC